MAGIDFTDSDEYRKLIKRIERMERGAPVGFSTISRGALVVKSPEGLIVEGSAKVTGTLQVDGILNADGTITLSGATTLTGDLSVEGGGKITVGALVLDPTIPTAGGSFGGLSSATAITLQSPTVVASADILAFGTIAAFGEVSGTDVRAQGDVIIETPSTKPGVTPNVYWDSADSKLKVIP